MGTPLIVRLLLDAQTEFAKVVDAVPDTTPPSPLNSPGWVVAHATFIHDCWINGDAQGKPKDDWDSWLVDWADRQRASRPDPIATDLADAQAALHRILPAATAFLSALTDGDLETVPPYEEGAWPAGTTVGYLVARAIAHLFAHASELNVISTAAGRPDAGLPGPLAATRGS
jgi:hypothetical protein